MISFCFYLFKKIKQNLEQSDKCETFKIIRNLYANVTFLCSEIFKLFSIYLTSVENRKHFNCKYEYYIYRKSVTSFKCIFTRTDKLGWGKTNLISSYLNLVLWWCHPQWYFFIETLFLLFFNYKKSSSVHFIKDSSFLW